MGLPLHYLIVLLAELCSAFFIDEDALLVQVCSLVHRDAEHPARDPILRAGGRFPPLMPYGNCKLEHVARGNFSLDTFSKIVQKGGAGRGRRVWAGEFRMQSWRMEGA